jgi:hypothetical protein
MSSGVRFFRDGQNPRWDDRQIRNWLDREIRFDGSFETLRVVCRIPRADFIHAFGPVPDEGVFDVFERHRLAIEAAALERICQGRYAADIDWGDRETVSIVLTGADIQRAIAAKPPSPPSDPTSPAAQTAQHPQASR